MTNTNLSELVVPAGLTQVQPIREIIFDYLRSAILEGHLTPNQKMIELCFYFFAIARPCFVVSEAKLRINVMAWIPADVQEATARRIGKLENILTRAGNSRRLRVRDFDLEVLIINLQVVSLFFFAIHVNPSTVEIWSNKQAGVSIPISQVIGYVKRIFYSKRKKTAKWNLFIARHPVQRPMANE